jgi:hypothetical protein
LFIAKDLTVDCNWNGQKGLKGNFKVDGIVVQTVRGKVDNVRVMNFGSDGGSYSDLGLECFPLSLWTFSNGSPFEYNSIYNSLIDKEATTFLEISECEVVMPFFVSGGYCSAIFIKTNYPNAGDRQPVGKRTSISAIVRNCYANVPGGLGFGGAGSEMVIYEGNIAENCKAGFNFDTFKADRITIQGNQFINCNQGINFTPNEGGNNIQINKNIFVVGDPFFNPILKAYEEFYAIRCLYLTNSSANDNIIIGKSSGGFKFLDGIAGSNNTTTIIGAATTNSNADIVALNSELNDTKNLLADSVAQNASLQNNITDLNNQNTTLNNRITDITTQLQNQVIQTNQTTVRFNNLTNAIQDILRKV